MKKLLLVLVSVLFITGCNSKEEEIKEDMLDINYEVESNSAELNYETSNPVVAMYIEDYGSVVMELYPEIAPNTVNNFISLVNDGFYDDNTFHRMIEGFVLQGGDPNGMGTGGPGYSIKGEFSGNGFENNLLHEKGIISMARSMDNDSAGSQFFIMLDEAPHLDTQYAAFGKVIDGMETVERIEKTERVSDTNGTLVTNLVLKKALVDLNDFTPSEVIKIEE